MKQFEKSLGGKNFFKKGFWSLYYFTCQINCVFSIIFLSFCEGFWMSSEMKTFSQFQRKECKIYANCMYYINISLKLIQSNKKLQKDEWFVVSLEFKSYFDQFLSLIHYNWMKPKLDESFLSIYIYDISDFNNMPHSCHFWFHHN